MTFQRTPQHRRRLGRGFIVLLALLSACQSTIPTVSTADADKVFKVAQKSDRIVFPDAAELARLDAPQDAEQRLGEGDTLNVSVWGRAELSGHFLVGPDGRITLPLAGSVRVADATREEAASRIGASLKRFYQAPAVTVGIEQYTSNRITVLGRVQNPGTLQFEHTPTVLEVLARAGSLPVIDKQATLTRCAIFRGREQIIWIDLKRLLNDGEIAQNLRLHRGDLIYIPDSFDTLVYVMGQVGKPGAYRLTPNMSLLDALAQAGGPNEDAAPEEIAIYRPASKAVQRVPLRSLLTADHGVNFALEEGDVIYVPKSGIADFGYVSRQIAAGLTVLTVGALLK
ncbi:SLBB domain-containing protein [Ralstonia solanacearum]|uniref:polysaccharide biosynthesis/export family protein n=1 Tax=Ralstonia solanacearum TaxID=305 RepID=UPI0005C791AB|nr:polysaccharide biosynthesis/export family protein [Ralstonia solanacearum]MDB0542244.1 SLBB domain-containing protein [Ralstonia solanacearum]MDB0552484.1 SLBB domain-containing protein [Ralstonia solanacearum]MDB0557208.1 SLBB domain-containing protein [Ralstonia solanacearum]